MTPHVRNLELWDSPAAAAIYNDAVANKLATFDVAPTSARDFEDDFRESIDTHPAIAVEDDGKLVAYAASSPHSSYEPYRGIAEFSVYVEASHRDKGYGKLAVRELIVRCTNAGFTKMLSRILAENAASRALCASLGFREVGIYERHAQLDGVWRDVVIEKLLEPS